MLELEKWAGGLQEVGKVFLAPLYLTLQCAAPESGLVANYLFLTLTYVNIHRNILEREAGVFLALFWRLEHHVGRFS